MQFIYLGEAKFYEERMSEFLQVSKDLEIKDLSTGIEMNDQTSSEESSENENNVAAEDVYEDLEETGSDANVDYQPQTVTRQNIGNKEANKKVSTTDGVKYACYQCDHQATRQEFLTRHIQSVHEGVKYACNKCDYQATQQSNLTSHVKRKHL